MHPEHGGAGSSNAARKGAASGAVHHPRRRRVCELPEAGLEESLGFGSGAFDGDDPLLTVDGDTGGDGRGPRSDGGNVP